MLSAQLDLRGLLAPLAVGAKPALPVLRVKQVLPVQLGKQVLQVLQDLVVLLDRPVRLDRQEVLEIPVRRDHKAPQVIVDHQGLLERLAKQALPAIRDSPATAARSGSKALQVDKALRVQLEAPGNLVQSEAPDLAAHKVRRANLDLKVPSVRQDRREAKAPREQLAPPAPPGCKVPPATQVRQALSGRWVPSGRLATWDPMVLWV